MHSRLVPVLTVVLLLATPLAGVPVGAAGTGSSAAPAVPVAAAQASNGSNATSVPGVGVVVDTAPAPGGGTYLVGATSPQAPNLTVTRLAADGSVTWQRILGGPNQSRAGRSVVGTDDGVYVLELVGPAQPGPGRPARSSARLVRLTADGTVQWTLGLGSGAAPPIRAGSDLLAADGDGVVYASPTRADPAGTRLLRIAADGSVDWNRSYAGGTPRALAVQNGDYLVAGQRAFSEAWLLRVDADGDVEVNRSYGDFRERRVVGVVPTDDGGALLAGSASVRGFGFGDPWVARVDPDGVPVWSRTYPAETASPQVAVPTDAGVLLIHRTTPEFGARGTRLTHVGSDGSVGTLRLASGRIATTARVTENGTVRLYGVRFDRQNRTVVGTATTTALPELERAALRGRTGLGSDATVYRGQDLRFDGATGVTYQLYRLPGEDAEFDRPRLTRRLRADANGTVSFETATLTSGRYAVGVADGFWLTLDGGEGVGITTNASLAAFELEDERIRIARPTPLRGPPGPRFSRPGPNRTVLETFRGERGVRVRIDAEREAFAAGVSLLRLNGSTPTPDTLRAALSADPQFRGTTDAVPSDRPHGVVGMPAGGDRNVTLDAGALEAGLYRLSVVPLDTADAVEPATTRLVVVTEERDVSLRPGDDAIVVPRGGEATTNLTLVGAEAGVGAIRIEANRTGGPPVGLHLELADALEIGSGSGGGGIGRDRSSAETQSLEVRRSPNGTFTVARLSVRSEPGFADEAPATGTNTLTVELAWILDADGVPYSLADPVTVRYEVTEANGTESTSAGG